MAWQSTIYVTNFPEHTDDASIRELFGKVSDTRSHLRRSKPDRIFSTEFCLTCGGRARNSRARGDSVMSSISHLYVSSILQGARKVVYAFHDQDAAKAALELHKHELAPGLPLSVMISNPERKKDRTDSDANDREVYVAGVSKFVTKGELEDVFKTVSISKCPTCHVSHCFFSMEKSKKSGWPSMIKASQKDSRSWSLRPRYAT